MLPSGTLALTPHGICSHAQTQDAVGYNGVKYSGALHCLRHTVETSGVQGLYKGISSPLLGSMAENAVLFWSYGIFKSWLGGQEAAARGEDMSLLRLSLAGAGAGAVVPCVLTPVELIKCRLQVRCCSNTPQPKCLSDVRSRSRGGTQVQNSINTGFRPYAGAQLALAVAANFRRLTLDRQFDPGPIDCLIQTVKREGVVRGLYKGNSAMLLREIPGNFAWYGVYEGTCKLCIPAGGSKKDLGTGEKRVCIARQQLLTKAAAAAKKRMNR